METIVQTPAPNTTKPRDIYQEVTDKIIGQLEKGCIPWQQPWKADGLSIPLSIPRNFVTGNKYRGVNIVLLWSSVMENNYQSHEWASFKQWKEKKEAIRKGEKGNLIVYYDTFEKEIDGEIHKIPFLKSSIVFNKCQLTSYTPEEIKVSDCPPLIERIEPAEEFIGNTGATVVKKGDRAVYKPAEDKIYMPLQKYFIDTPTCTATEGYYSTLMHELTHWTGNDKRLNRAKGKKFGDHQYAAEELVGEFGAAFLCAGFGIATIDKGDHAAYIENWLKALKDNKQILFSAASEASKAVDFLCSLQP